MPSVFSAPLFVLDLAAALYLWGVIWTIQLVHYPLFARVGATGWKEYHASHTRCMTWVVLPAMVTELGSSSLLVLAHSPWLVPSLLWGGFACAALTWAVTFFVSVPLHQALACGFHPVAAARLVATNWLRTALWTGHAALLMAQLWLFLPKT